jgi:hypothetical protein
MKISLRQNNININRNINKRLNNYFYLFKNNIYNEEYINQQIFSTYKELNNGTLIIRIRLCCFCNYSIMINLTKDCPILFKDIINVILINLNENKNHKRSIYCNYPTPTLLEDIELLKYNERYNQLETIL